MAIIQKDFNLLFEVTNIGSIKGWKETKVDGVTYPPTVKFRARIVETKEDPDVGLREIETIVDFIQPVKNIDQLVALQEILYKKRSNKESVSLRANLPKKDSADEILKVKSIDSIDDFCKLNKISLPE